MITSQKRERERENSENREPWRKSRVQRRRHEKGHERRGEKKQQDNLRLGEAGKEKEREGMGDTEKSVWGKWAGA